MRTTTVRRMAKNPGGRPRDGEEKGSKLIRVNDDLAEMISWLVRVKGGTAATIVDPLLRPQITRRYETISQHVEKIKLAEAAVRKAEEAAKSVRHEPERE